MRIFSVFFLSLVLVFAFCSCTFAIDADDIQVGTKFTRLVFTNGDGDLEDFRIRAYTDLEQPEYVFLNFERYVNGVLVRQELLWTLPEYYYSAHFKIVSYFDQSKLYHVGVQIINPDGEPSPYLAFANIKLVGAGIVEWEDFANPSPSLPTGTVLITLPVYDGYVSSDDLESVSFTYKVPLPASGDENDINYRVSGGISGTFQVIADHRVVSGNNVNGKVSGVYRFSEGDNVMKVVVTSPGEGSWFAERLITVVRGYVDEDGDGYDDRTGKPIFPPYPDTGDGPPQPPGPDATIFDYIKYLVDSVLYSMSQLVIMLRGFMSGLTQFTQILSQFFSFMPAQFTGIIFLGLIMAVILRVVGR